MAWAEGPFDPSLVGCWGAYGAEQNFGSQHRPPSLRGLMAGPKVKGGPRVVIPAQSYLPANSGKLEQNQYAYMYARI